jgi:hypothetical protein
VRLEGYDPRLARLVELRYRRPDRGETAARPDLPTTVKRDWFKARLPDPGDDRDGGSDRTTLGAALAADRLPLDELDSGEPPDDLDRPALPTPLEARVMAYLAPARSRS